MNLKKINIDLIKPYWRNPRNNELTVPQVMKSIERYGFNVPLVLDKNNVIITGHARYKALKLLGYTEIFCVLSDMDEKKAREYRLADNKIQEQSLWNMDLFKLELRDMPDAAEIASMFGDMDIQRLLDDSAGASVPDYDEGDMKRAEDKLDGAVREDKKKRDIVCPACGEIFYIDMP